MGPIRRQPSCSGVAPGAGHPSQGRPGLTDFAITRMGERSVTHQFFVMTPAQRQRPPKHNCPTQHCRPYFAYDRLPSSPDPRRHLLLYGQFGGPPKPIADRQYSHFTRRGPQGSCKGTVSYRRLGRAAGPSSRRLDPAGERHELFGPLAGHQDRIFKTDSARRVPFRQQGIKRRTRALAEKILGAYDLR